MELLMWLSGFALAYGIFSPSNEDHIKAFKDKLCIEKEVGNSTIKKCYQIIEVK